MPDLKPTFRRRLARVLNRIRARGPKEVLALGLDRVRGWVGSADALVVFVRDPTSTQGREGLTFREASPGDAPDYARAIGTDSPTTFQARLAADVRCFLVEADGRLMHSSWVTTTGAWTREIAAYMCPPAGDAYVYESFTRADARGRGIYPFALTGILDWAAGSGIARVWVAIETGNEASRRAITKAGFSEAFTLPFERKLGRVRSAPPTGPMADEGRSFVRPSP